MNSTFDNLQEYPFQILKKLKQNISHTGSLSTLSLAIGEPKHASPQHVKDAIINGLDGLAIYPTTRGSEVLLEAIASWVNTRFKLNGSIKADQHILPVNGTREALFAFAQTVIDSKANSLVLSPNPFYQIYEGAAFFAGATPAYLNCYESNGFIPDFDKVDEATWQRCRLIYLCSPGNPTGAVIPKDTLEKLINLSEKYDFIIASDECYSEIYNNEENPPIGLLEVAHNMGKIDYKNCMVFHSLSKRSNLPGLRSGFVAGDKALIDKFFLYRTYHGSAMSPTVQIASIAAWSDEKHVIENRQYYREKYDAVLDILNPVMDITKPEASFYLWPKTETCDVEFSLKLFEEQNLHILPGSLLSRDDKNGINPGKNRVRLALVAPLEETKQAAQRIVDFIK